MPWEIHLYALRDTYLYMFSLRGGARTDLYTCLVAPPPSLFDLEKGLYVYTYGLYKISCTHMDIVYIVYTYGYSIKTPPGGFRWKTEKFFE